MRAFRGGGDDDIFLALSHRSGAVSHLRASAVTAAPGPRFRVLGSAGAFVVRELDGQEDQLRSGLAADDASFGVEPPQRWGTPCAGGGVRACRAEPWRLGVVLLARRRRAGGEGAPPVDPIDAVATLTVLDAARAGAGDGELVVTS